MDGRIIGYIGASQFLREIIADKRITRVEPDDLRMHGIQPESQYFAMVFQYENGLLNRLELNQMCIRDRDNGIYFATSQFVL